MKLVVEELSLLIGALDRRKLPSARGISSCDAGGLVQDEGGTSRDGDSCLDHDLVDDFWVRLHLEITSLGNTDEP